MFDFERKRFWKLRFATLFGSILRYSRRRLKTILLVGFHKFALKSLLAKRFWKPSSLNFSSSQEYETFNKQNQRPLALKNGQRSKTPVRGGSPSKKSPKGKSPMSKSPINKVTGKAIGTKRPSTSSLN